MPYVTTPEMAALEDMIMDYEAVQPLFIGDDNDEFYEDSMGKDLFKKFTLYPTPPGSPDHEPTTPDLDPDSRLALGSHNLEDYESLSHTRLSPLSEECDDCLEQSSNLIQDCMWSAPGLAAAGLLSPSDMKKSISKVSQSVERTSCTVVGTNPRIRHRSPEGPSMCVDPTAVFPYPVSGSSEDGPSSSAHRLPFSQTLSLGSVAETPSPSESEEDEEEIDVVTVDKTRRHHRIVPPAKPMSFSAHVASMHNYSNTNSAPPISYSAPQSPQSHSNHCHKVKATSMPGSPLPPGRKPKSLLQTPDLKRVVHKLKMRNSKGVSHHRNIPSGSSSSSSCLNSSDSEDGLEGSKRAQHNVLERKRRNDLKYSFMRLKDTVPELSSVDRAAKVIILKKSADYVKRLRATNEALVREYEKQKRLNDQWKWRLRQCQEDLLID